MPNSVQSSFLCDKYKLLNTLFRKLTGFLQDILHGNAPVITADIGDDTVRASLVTALCDLKICIVAACCKAPAGS